MSGRALVGGPVGAAAVPLAISGLLAVLSSRPMLAAKVFGGEPNPSRLPADRGLTAIDVDCAPGCRLGCGSGAHVHTGGNLEAADIEAAVRWAVSEGSVPVAVFGFSAGRHAAAAATHQMSVFAVMTDSSTDS